MNLCIPSVNKQFTPKPMLTIQRLSTIAKQEQKNKIIVNQHTYPDCSTVNSPEAIRADNSARLFSSKSFSTFLTPSSTDSGCFPLELEHLIVKFDTLPLNLGERVSLDLE